MAAIVMTVTADLKVCTTTVVAGVVQAFRPAVDDQLRVGFARAGGYTVTTLPLETYVARVLAGEAAHDSPPAALDALAITVRSYALANRSRHRADGFDLCDQTHCQVVRAATAVTDRAAGRTAGRVLVHDGAPASIYYTASCGGRTEIPSAVWPGAPDPPYLRSKKDAACGGAPVWTADVVAADLLRALRAAGFRGNRLRNLRIVARDRSGRVAQLELEGLTPDRISGQDLRVTAGRTLGWQHIKSTAFDVERTADRYRFTGHGSGHGVGLCVIGSVHLAADGKSAADILRRYFPGLEIAPFVRRSTTVPAAAPVMVSLPDEDEGQRSFVDDLMSRERDDLARRLSVVAPARMTLRVHPTTNSFEQATGRPWFTSGAVVNGELHLLPLASLRERGVLERTIRHELVHVMTDPVLATRPLWVREGAAVYFAERTEEPTPQTRVVCPSDAELSRPVSIGALSNAYARARACFARQIAAGTSWREVR
jgi:SpoIID/LytB domain protein